MAAHTQAARALSPLHRQSLRKDKGEGILKEIKRESGLKEIKREGGPKVIKAQMLSACVPPTPSTPEKRFPFGGPGMLGAFPKQKQWPACRPAYFHARAGRHGRASSPLAPQ
eukprot:356930-Chlamydomonas_euryale.AAC.4